MGLTAYWFGAWQRLNIGPPLPGVFDDLVERYGEAHRAYHTLQHLEECFRLFDEVVSHSDRPGELMVGLWFHDAVYDTHAADNEVRSAALASQTLLACRAGADLVHRVHELILATRHDTVPAAGDQALIVDVDLAILAAPEPRFDEYEAQIRREYAWVPESVFRQTRAGILVQFLNRPAVYFTEHLRERFEDRARSNLRRSLSRLAGLPG